MAKENDPYAGAVEVPAPIEGQIYPATVEKVEHGLAINFIAPEKRDKWKHLKPDDKGVNLTLKSEGSVTLAKMLVMPADGKIPANSPLGKYKRIYGDYPREGHKVNLVGNKRGYLDLFLGK